MFSVNLGFWTRLKAEVSAQGLNLYYGVVYSYSQAWPDLTVEKKYSYSTVDQRIDIKNTEKRHLNRRTDREGGK